MKKFLLIAAIAGITFSATAKDINFGLNPTYAPYEFYDENNQIVGFDIDIANQICQELQYTCKFTNQSFDSLIPSLKTRRIDAVISAMDVTEARKKQVDFTNFYYTDNGATFTINKDNFKSVQDLNGKRVGVQNGTTHQKYLMQMHPEINVVNYDSYEYAILDLNTGRIDAILSDNAVANDWLTNNNSLSQLGEKVTDPAFYGSGLAIALRKNNTELLEQINQALSKMKTDGSYDVIYKKWFGIK